MVSVFQLPEIEFHLESTCNGNCFFCQDDDVCRSGMEALAHNLSEDGT